jgi:hypothetical protein
MNEVISADSPNPEVFPALRSGRVVAGFCGHDHTNDFCALWKGVQLCYEGSPGFQAYGDCEPAKGCWTRRARVTRLELSPDRRALARLRSWKRLDAGGAVAGRAVDEEVLWSSSGGGQEGAHRKAAPLGRALPQKKQTRLRVPEYSPA